MYKICRYMSGSGLILILGSFLGPDLVLGLVLGLTLVLSPILGLISWLWEKFLLKLFKFFYFIIFIQIKVSCLWSCFIFRRSYIWRNCGFYSRKKIKNPVSQENGFSSKRVNFSRRLVGLFSAGGPIASIF